MGILVGGVFGFVANTAVEVVHHAHQQRIPSLQSALRYHEAPVDLTATSALDSAFRAYINEEGSAPAVETVAGNSNDTMVEMAQDFVKWCISEPAVMCLIGDRLQHEWDRREKQAFGAQNRI